MKQLIKYIFAFFAIIALLSVVWVDISGLPIGELAGQWAWLGKTCVLFAISVFIMILAWHRDKNIVNVFNRGVVWSLILIGGCEAIYGLRQIYGYASSNHSLFALTGSFFNPGPYSGYLAMVFPLCLNEWLQLKNKSDRSVVEQIVFYLAGGTLLLIICVLPAGMSRSAWLAAAISGLWICSLHYSWGRKLRLAWRENHKKVIAILACGLVCLIIGGAVLFYLKKDSASGRLFMWKISCLVIGERPLTGYGIDGFAYAYGRAQEEYFAKGNYSLQEELVAGSPEYAFNEYLQVIIEWGIGGLLVLLMIIIFCLHRGIKGRRISLCGAVISLMVFAFSSYPMQLPAFVIAFFLLLAACAIGNSRIGLAVFALLIGVMGMGLWKEDVSKECKEWTSVKMLYNIGAYESAKEDYQKLYPVLKNRGAFLFEYGHCLHKQKEYGLSTSILKEAVIHNCDPMILNVIGKNYQAQKEYEMAEKYFIRSTHRLPGRIYPYYLLAKLYAECNRTDKVKEMAEIVLTKEPKVYSTAVKEMRVEMKNLLKLCEIK